MPIINRPLLEEVRSLILANPKGCSMGCYWTVYGRPSNYVGLYALHEGPYDLRTASIDGWICSYVGTWNAFLFPRDPYDGQPFDLAMNLAGLTHDQAMSLFHLSLWPMELRDAYRRGSVAEAMAEAIEWFLADPNGFIYGRRPQPPEPEEVVQTEPQTLTVYLPVCLTVVREPDGSITFPADSQLVVDFDGAPWTFIGETSNVFNENTEEWESSDAAEEAAIVRIGSMGLLWGRMAGWNGVG